MSLAKDASQPGAAAPAAPTPRAGGTSHLGGATPARRARQIPRDPRRRGPLLFGLVLAAIALAEGILGMADVAGADVARPAYPALALGIVGAGLVLGSFWGRAGGLIFLGLIGTVALVGSVAANEWDVSGRQISVAPTSAATLQSSYHFDLGQAEIDLSRIKPSQLTGRTLSVEGHIGQIKITVPDGLEVRAHGEVDGPGRVAIFDSDRSGFSSELSQTRSVGTAVPGTGTPVLTVEASLDVGSIQILDEDDPDAYRSIR